MATSYYTDFSTDSRASQIISGQFLELFTGATALTMHPALRYGGSADVRGSKVIRVPHFALNGYDLMASTAEGTDVTSTAIGTGHTDVTIARYALGRDVGDLARMTDPNGILDYAKLGASMYASYTRTLLSLVCNVIDDGGTSQTCSSTATADDFLAAKGKLAGASGPLLAILHSKQWSEIQRDLGTTSGGSLQFDPATPALVAQFGPGYAGNFAGVDIFVTDDVVSSGGDRKGGILAPDAIVWGDGIPAVDGFVPGQTLIGGKVLYEPDRNAGKGYTRFIANAYLGVSAGISARLCTFNSDA